MEIYYFYEKGLNGYDYELFNEEIISVPQSSFDYHINHNIKSFYKKIENDIIKLNYKDHYNVIEDFLNNKITNAKHYFKNIYTVDINGLPLQFEVLSNDKILFSHDLSIFNFKNLPSFIKKSFIGYYSKQRGYDIEWTGQNYQTIHYLSRFYFINPCEEIIKKEINEFESILENLPLDFQFYNEFGYDINIEKSGKGYPAFPYTFSINFKDEDRKYKPLGISNVFETKEEAKLKAIYYLWLEIFIYKDFNTDNPIVNDSINKFNSFIHEKIKIMNLNR